MKFISIKKKSSSISDNPEIYARVMSAFENVQKKKIEKSFKLTFYTVFYSHNEKSRRF